ncbi:uncharacterized protein LOC132753458 [Ruditapes philippinarum]|uniref:uncharacterized protein LOC132753458 n=1 Tax=Ruditapes philippinarum TaxID=129788 RepID=UPI00295B2F31|nr:uncharacterized protein LOC132753458 [Ruditapes philippinarum]
MSYLRRWRQNEAAAQALAESSDEDDVATNMTVVNVGGYDITSSSEFFDENNVSYNDDSDDNLSDYGFSETIVSSETDSETDNLSDEENDESTLREQLATWATSNNLSKKCVDDLLKLLTSRCNTYLPKDSRTLLKTPKMVDYVEKCGGKFIYFGIRIGLLKILSLKSFSLDASEQNTIKLNFNIDGIPLFKSTGTQFWPILCNFKSYTPFMVAIFYSSHKPNSLEEFLIDFIEELNELISEGIQLDNTKLPY